MDGWQAIHSDPDDVVVLLRLLKQITELLDDSGQYPAAKLIVAIAMGSAVDADVTPLRKAVSEWFHENVDLDISKGRISIQSAWPEMFNDDL